MTKKQIEQFNRMRLVLLKISKQYMNPDQLRSHNQKVGGAWLDYEEELELAYENIQSDAREAVRNVREIKLKETNANNRQTEQSH